MWVKYNSNPAGRSVGDCAVRAVAKALGINWKQAFAKIVANAFVMCDMPSSNAVWGSYLKSRGFLQVTIPNTCPDCYTIKDFCEEHPQGVYVLGTGNHACCIKDGCLYDAWDSSQETPVYYFRR